MWIPRTEERKNYKFKLDRLGVQTTSDDITDNAERRRKPPKGVPEVKIFLHFPDSGIYGPQKMNYVSVLLLAPKQNNIRQRERLILSTFKCNVLRAKWWIRRRRR